MLAEFYGPSRRLVSQSIAQGHPKRIDQHPKESKRLPTMAFLKVIHQFVAFSLEIAMLISLGLWGFHGDQSTGLKYLLGLGLPLLAAGLWGILAAPRSSHRLGLPFRLLFSLALFGLAAALLYKLGYTRLAFVFAALAVISALPELVFD